MQPKQYELEYGGQNLADYYNFHVIQRNKESPQSELCNVVTFHSRTSRYEFPQLLHSLVSVNRKSRQGILQISTASIESDHFQRAARRICINRAPVYCNRTLCELAGTDAALPKFVYRRYGNSTRYLETEPCGAVEFCLRFEVICSIRPISFPQPVGCSKWVARLSNLHNVAFYEHQGAHFVTTAVVLNFAGRRHKMQTLFQLWYFVQPPPLRRLC